MSDFTTESTSANDAILKSMKADKPGKVKPALTRVVVSGSYMFSPQPGFLAKLIRGALGRENLDGVEVRTTDSKGVALAAQGMVEASTNLKGRVFLAKEEDGGDRWKRRTERLLKGADHVLVCTTGKQGTDNNEGAWVIQGAKQAKIPLTIYRA